MLKQSRALILFLLFTSSAFAKEIAVAPKDYWEQTGFWIGLYSTGQFMLDSECGNGCIKTPQADWYFQTELTLIPKKSEKVADFSLSENATKDVPSPLDTDALPPLIWIGSGEVVLNTQIKFPKTNEYFSNSILNYDPYWANTKKLQLTEKITTNQSYFNAASATFFKDKRVKLRGFEGSKSFIARTIWPIDFKIDPYSPLKPLGQNESLKSLVQYENGGAQSPFESRLLWAKDEWVKNKWALADANSRFGSNKTVLAVMLNGAQGDDDEAHGGHFAVATGRMDDMSNWLVNNYYNLASNSEKGIIAAPTPMDKYLMDLNNGQSYYRPSYMLVAVFKEYRVPVQFQAATNRVYQHLYRNDFVYDHSLNNCAGISIDTLRKLGWNVPTRGVTSQLKATAAYFYVATTERSLTKGRAIYDYLNTETTRLFPAVAFDEIGNDLFNRLLNPASKAQQNGKLEQQLKQDIEAVYFVRIPQIPSSRAFGMAPVYSFDQFMAQAPADRSQWKVVPTTPNLMPENLKSGLALKLEKPSLVPWPAVVVLALFLASLIWCVRKLRNKFRG